MTISSGHPCYPPAVISQPVLQGLTKRIPVFMWIAQSSEALYPVLIEIEKPGKRWFKQDGDPTADLSHAIHQLATWRTWFENPVNEIWFRQYYELNEQISDRVLEPAYVLIYGRRSEFAGKPELNRSRASLRHENEYFMTYDRLGLDQWAQDYVTCKKPKPDGYEIIEVPPTFAWGRSYLAQLAQMRGWDAAVGRCGGLTAERRAFLLERRKFWLDQNKRSREPSIRGTRRE